MIISEDIKQKIIYDIQAKSANNTQRQAYIHPSKYGLRNNSDGMKEFLEYILSLPLVKTAKIAGKDLIDLTVY